MSNVFNLSDKFNDFFQENGFCILRGVNNSDIEDITHALSSIIGLSYNEQTETRKVFNHALTAAGWGHRCKRMWDNLPLINFYSGKEIRNVLSEVGFVSPIWSTRPEVRFDFPEDGTFTQPWHQDFMYSQTSLNSVTFWMPLHDVTIRDGALQIIPGSHKNGVFPFDVLQNPRRFRISETLFEEKQILDVEMKKGDILIFSQFLVHRSGKNSSDSVRLSVQGRFADMSCSFFRDSGFETTSTRNLELVRKF